MDVKIGIVVDVWEHRPARPDNEEDRAMSEYASEIEGYGWFLHPLFLGGYSDTLLNCYQKHGLMPGTEAEDFETIRQPVDFYGLNFYNGLVDHADNEKEKRRRIAEGGNIQNKPEQHLEAVYDVLRMLVEKYHVTVPIYITENGAAQMDRGDKEPETFLDDGERIEYLEKVLTWVNKAIEDGIDVRGYYIWSLLDNFEWSAGTAMRFGLYYIDYRTLEKIPKKSAFWYRNRDLK